ncbi:MAG: rRNA pseudouridine synthase, partial [Puniceicoccales bacterium]|nr:rRNA pseudouridine synthase [Puniceicoccales bacterium]
MEQEQERLQKFLSRSGICSRRQGELWIREGRIRVNGIPAVLGQLVCAGKDHISVDGKNIKARPTHRRWVLLLNKPRGVICSHGDPKRHERTVFDFIPQEYRQERFLFCGRLDKDSQGMLLLTNDGAFVQKVTHPRSNITKIYHVSLQHAMNSQALKRMKEGIEDAGECLVAEEVCVLSPGEGNSRCCLEIHLKQGRKREIRRMVEALGNRVHRLKRVQIGRLKMRGIPPG